MVKKKPRSEKEVLEFNARRMAAGILAKQVGIAESAKISGLSPRVIKYWKQKSGEPSFHNQKHGGWRYVKLIVS
jgi:hypothetical protein